MQSFVFGLPPQAPMPRPAAVALGPVGWKYPLGCFFGTMTAFCPCPCCCFPWIACIHGACRQLKSCSDSLLDGCSSGWCLKWQLTIPPPPHPPLELYSLPSYTRPLFVSICDCWLFNHKNSGGNSQDVGQIWPQQSKSSHLATRQTST